MRPFLRQGNSPSRLGETIRRGQENSKQFTALWNPNLRHHTHFPSPPGTSSFDANAAVFIPSSTMQVSSATSPPNQPQAPCPTAAVSTRLGKLNGQADGANFCPSPTQPPTPLPPTAPYPVAAVSTRLGKLNGPEDGATLAAYPVAAVSTRLGKLNGPADEAKPTLSQTQTQAETQTQIQSQTQPPHAPPSCAATVSTRLGKLNGPVAGRTPLLADPSPPSQGSETEACDLGSQERGPNGLVRSTQTSDPPSVPPPPSHPHPPPPAGPVVAKPTQRPEPEADLAEEHGRRSLVTRPKEGAHCSHRG